MKVKLVSSSQLLTIRATRNFNWIQKWMLSLRSNLLYRGSYTYSCDLLKGCPALTHTAVNAAALVTQNTDLIRSSVSYLREHAQWYLHTRSNLVDEFVCGASCLDRTVCYALTYGSCYTLVGDIMDLNWWATAPFSELLVYCHGSVA